MSPPDLTTSIDRYEAGLRAHFGTAFRPEDLDLKHDKMRRSAFLFLRATCWRWAECAAVLCPDLMGAPSVASVGDAHAGNFGLWRDAQFRLVWGINDYDEAARLPYALDLVRLCASILVADDGLDAGQVADTLLDSYAEALTAPQPIVLEGDRLWLRDLFEATNDDRIKYWNKLRDAQPAPVEPPEFEAPLLAALPDELSDRKIAPRAAGAGSLGRPRFAASGIHRGGPVAAEIKGVMPSCWVAGREAGLAQRMATGQHRSPDPTLVYGTGHAVRWLSPNDRKLDFDELAKSHRDKLVATMAAELAAVHAADADVHAIHRHLRRQPEGWLAGAAQTGADWTVKEWHSYR
ncbi:DUF2252 family protein [Azospirillum sp. YIM B02556]|uniref:DUF2252 family protein n=1 Tax=Azospirillum endophyticum TaxID=2800326 RepID=A0ABS1F190_9PROT|nr:DUF2252 family protein [Azospirillum endophyticum]MBK1837188.1 DUF2252 family protein [Azospirillum endophyticum]